MKSKYNAKGFTLIELLVVIAIIGLLASVVLVALNGARKKARITKRVADLKQIQTALELYYNDNNQYPATVGWRSQCAGWGSLASNQVVWDVTLSKGLVPTYLGVFPPDPSMVAASNQNCYLYESDGTDYKLMDYVLIDMTLADINAYAGFKDPARNDNANTAPCNSPDSNNSLAIYSPGGKCF